MKPYQFLIPPYHMAIWGILSCQGELYYGNVGWLGNLLKLSTHQTCTTPLRRFHAHGRHRHKKHDITQRCDKKEPAYPKKLIKP